jgi:hypothetical protein
MPRGAFMAFTIAGISAAPKVVFAGSKHGTDRGIGFGAHPEREWVAWGGQSWSPPQ